MNILKGYSDSLNSDIIILTSPVKNEISSFKKMIDNKCDNIILDDEISKKYSLIYKIKRDEEIDFLQEKFNEFYSKKRLYGGSFTFMKEQMKINSRKILYTYAHSFSQAFIFFCERLANSKEYGVRSRDFYLNYFKCRKTYNIFDFKNVGYGK